MCGDCQCNPCQCDCSCDPANEPLSSALDNFITSFFGTLTKTCVNGEIVWVLPCNLDSAPITGYPRLPNEGLACYFSRVINLVLSANPVNYINGEIPTGAIDGVNMVFGLVDIPLASKDSGYLNGARQQRGVDYTLAGATITFTIPPPLLSTILWDYWI